MVAQSIPNANSRSSDVFNYARRSLMPGFDLCTRRRVKLQRHWQTGPRRFLDAGSGNGWFSYLAYCSGATVTAISAVGGEIEKAKHFYNHWMGIPDERLSFRELNFYQVESLGFKFDEIICYEALEHVRDDVRVAMSFHRLLNPGGVLHLCCPNADHPRWQAEVLDHDERGGHVRAGYTDESYRNLLEPLGFEITAVEGVGGPLLSKAELALSKVRNRFGDLLSVPFALSLLPTVWLDGTTAACPFSLYVKAKKIG